MDRRLFFTILAGGVVAGIGAKAQAAPLSAEPREMQYGWGPRPYYGYGWGRPRPWRRGYYGYGPGPWGPPAPWRRRCWINRWGERVCRF